MKIDEVFVSVNSQGEVLLFTDREEAELRGTVLPHAYITPNPEHGSSVLTEVYTQEELEERLDEDTGKVASIHQDMQDMMDNYGSDVLGDRVREHIDMEDVVNAIAWAASQAVEGVVGEIYNDGQRIIQSYE